MFFFFWWWTLIYHENEVKGNWHKPLSTWDNHVWYMVCKDQLLKNIFFLQIVLRTLSQLQNKHIYILWHQQHLQLRQEGYSIYSDLCISQLTFKEEHSELKIAINGSAEVLSEFHEIGKITWKSKIISKR